MISSFPPHFFFSAAFSVASRLTSPRAVSGGIARRVEGERSGGVRVGGGGEGRCGWPGSAALGLGLLFWRRDAMTMRTFRCHCSDCTIQIGDPFLHRMGAPWSSGGKKSGQSDRDLQLDTNKRGKRNRRDLRFAKPTKGAFST